MPPIPPTLAVDSMICLSPGRARPRKRPGSHLRSIFAGRMVGAVTVGIILGACFPIGTANASDAVELFKGTYTLGVEKLRLAYVTGLDVYKTSLQSSAQPPATDDNRPRADRDQSGDPVLRQLIAEASNRFGVPERWIRAIMLVESDSEIRATSPKGAMGLMQVMPDTYADLRDRFGFGNDPYAIRDNILAGSAYIREMYDRYGSPGFIAAYNAGPSRYDDYLTNGRELPDETLRYIVAVGVALGEKFEGQVFGKLPLGARPVLRFREPITVSSNGAMLASRTGQPVTVTDRLALHSLLARAVGLSGSR